jgi:hypothetical protein
MILTSGYPPYFSLPDKVKGKERGSFLFWFSERTEGRMMRKKEFVLSSLAASRTLDRLANNNAFALMNT